MSDQWQDHVTEDIHKKQNDVTYFYKGFL